MMPPIFLLLISALIAVAQLPPGDPSGLNPALARLFVDFPGFSARAYVRVQEKNDEKSLQVPLDFQFLEGNMRAEIDMTQVRSKELPRDFLSNLKQIGMDRIITLMQSERRETAVIYPGLQAVVRLPSATPTNGVARPPPPLKKKRLSTETVDGHSCEKYRVTLADSSGESQEALVWEAKDLKNFPVQIQMKRGTTSVWVLYREIKMERPDPQVFEIPKGSREFDNVQKVMEEAVKRLLGNSK